MKWEIYYTEKAESDLRAVYEYIAYNLCVPIAAQKQVRDIMNTISGLDSNPFGFPVYKKEPWRSSGLRYFPVHNYLVFYLPDEQNYSVNIIRIMYGGRNIEDQL